MKGYLVQDKSGDIIAFYGNKPEKEHNYWDAWDFKFFRLDEAPEGLNPRWEDDEPIEIEIEIHARS